MADYTFIYCNRCKEFRLNWGTDYESETIYCPVCYRSDVTKLHASSFAEMCEIERRYKVNELVEKSTIKNNT